MKKRLFIILILLLIILVSIFIFIYIQKNHSHRIIPKTKNTAALLTTHEQEILLNHAKLISEKMNDPIMINAVVNSNMKYMNYTVKQFLQLDTQLKTTDNLNPVLHSLLNNTCAQQLKRLQREHPELAEIFITNKLGFNVCQTNKTTDYYQADEEWWQESYANGQGKEFFGQLEYDQSAATVALPFYTPIRDKSHNVIGVAKFIILPDILH